MALLWVEVERPEELRGRLPGGRDLPAGVDELVVRCLVCHRRARLSLGYVAEWLAGRVAMFAPFAPNPFVHAIRPGDGDAWYRDRSSRAAVGAAAGTRATRPESPREQDAHPSRRTDS